MRALIFSLILTLPFSAVFAEKLPAFSKFFEGSSIGEVSVKKSMNFQASWVDPKDEVIVDALLNHMELAHELLGPVFVGTKKLKNKVPIEIFPTLRTFSALSGNKSYGFLIFNEGS